jgi:hypothetical protein
MLTTARNPKHRSVSPPTQDFGAVAAFPTGASLSFLAVNYTPSGALRHRWRSRKNRLAARCLKAHQGLPPPALKKAGIVKPFRPWHDLRHTALTHEAAAGRHSPTRPPLATRPSTCASRPDTRKAQSPNATSTRLKFSSPEPLRRAKRGRSSGVVVEKQ